MVDRFRDYPKQMSCILKEAFKWLEEDSELILTTIKTSFVEEFTKLFKLTVLHLFYEQMTDFTVFH